MPYRVIAPAPADVIPPELGQLHNLIVISTGREGGAAARVLVERGDQGVQLLHLVQKSLQIGFRHPLLQSLSPILANKVRIATAACGKRAKLGSAQSCEEAP